MSIAEELYPKERFTFSNYQPIIDYFGTPIVQVDDDDYQGDSRILYRLDDGRFAYLKFGWGSCSGCDALQGADSYAEVDELIEGLRNSMTYFPDAQCALDWFQNRDWKLQYESHCKEFKDFINQCTCLLMKEIREKRPCF